MQIANHHIGIKSIAAIITAVGLALVLVFSMFSSAANASSVIGVSSNIAQVPNGESLKLTVKVQNDGDVHALEIDHSLQDIYPEFWVYADENDPYGGDPGFAAAGVTVSYSAANSEWTIDFGPAITQGIVDEADGNVSFYFVLRDADRNELWGTMYGTTPENTFNFDLIEGTGDVLVPVEEDEEVVIPGVPNTSIVQ